MQIVEKSFLSYKARKFFEKSLCFSWEKSAEKRGEKCAKDFCATVFVSKRVALTYDILVVVENFYQVFHSPAQAQLSLTDLISSSISKEKAEEAMIFFSTVSIEEMMVVWLRLRILPMPGKDISVMLRIK